MFNQSNDSPLKTVAANIVNAIKKLLFPGLKFKLYNFTKSADEPGASIICNFTGNKLLVSLCKQTPGQYTIDQKTKVSTELSDQHVAAIYDILTPGALIQGPMIVQTVNQNNAKSIFLLSHYSAPVTRAIRIGVSVVPPGVDKTTPNFDKIAKTVEITLTNEQTTMFRIFMNECLKYSFKLNSVKKGDYYE